MRNFFEDWLAILKGKSDKTFKLGNWELSETSLVRVVSGIAVVLVMYLVGMLAQFINNYAAYMASGGFVGGELPKTSFAPYKAFYHLFSAGGLKAILLLIIGGLVVYVCIKYKEKIFGYGEYDERGFRKTKDGLYGTADWMTDKEAKEVLEIGNINTVRGNILGEKDGRLYCLPVETRFNRHTMIIGASGTMKSRAIVRNHIFQAIRRGESVGITDPKGEMFTDCYELFKKNGYEVKVLNLVNPEHGNQWNCMSDLEGDTLLAQMLTNVVIGNTSDGGKGDEFWENGERNLLKALILYVDNHTAIPKEERSLAKVYEILTTNSEKELYHLFEVLPADHPAKVPYNLFARSDDKVKSGFVLGLGTRLQVLQNEAVKNLISGNDIDLTMLGRKKSAIFVILPDQDQTMKFISSLFFSLMFVKLTRYADERPDKKCEVPVNLILDEFNNVGRIGGSEDGSDFARTLSVIRSRDVRITIAIQSLGQLQNRYPKNLWAELQGNCDIQIMLGCNDDITADYISERSGEMSIQVDSTRRSRKAFALFEVVPDYQQTEGKGKRKVLNKDEVLRLEPMEELVILRGYNLLKLRKWDYTNHPMSKEIRPVSVFDYYASGVDYDTVEKKEAEASEKVTREAELAAETQVTATAPVEVNLGALGDEPKVDDAFSYIFGGIEDCNAAYGSGNPHFDNPIGSVSADDDGHVNPSETPSREAEPKVSSAISSIVAEVNAEHTPKPEKKKPAYAGMEDVMSGKSNPTVKVGDVTVDKGTGEVIEDVPTQTPKTPQEHKPHKSRNNPNRPGVSPHNPISVSKNSADMSNF